MHTYIIMEHYMAKSAGIIIAVLLLNGINVGGGGGGVEQLVVYCLLYTVTIPHPKVWRRDKRPSNVCIQTLHVDSLGNVNAVA